MKLVKNLKSLACVGSSSLATDYRHDHCCSASTTLLGLAVVIRLQSNKFSADWVYSSENYIREFSCAF